MSLPICRRLCSNAAAKITEALLKQKLNTGFPKASEIQVQDISGGCGAMFEIYVESSEFIGLNRVKQHQLVNKVLSDEVKAMHGIRISTAVPESK